MTRRGFLGFVPLSTALAAQKKPRKPDIEIVKISSVRQGGRIEFEGAVKVTGEKPVAGLVIHFEFFESRNVLLTIQKIQVEDALIAPGEEKQFHVQGSDVPRAVSFRLSATNADGRDLSVAGVGPYSLD